MAAARITGGLVGGLVVVLVLAGTHWLSWQAGARSKHAEWTEKAERAAEDAAARVRQIEQERFHAAERAATNYHAELDEARDAASGARAELRRLRRDLAALDRAAGVDSAAGSGAYGAAAGGTLLGECAERYIGMAQEADSLAAQLRGLQEYVSGVLAAEH